MCAVEAIRGCGYRHVGGLYLCGEYISVPCDRLPYPLDICPVCGGGIKVSRGFTRINPLRLFGFHDFAECDGKSGMFIQKCHDKIRPCFMCDPKDEPAFIMGVGEKFYKTPGDFLEEAHRLGISKRIPSRENWSGIPKELELGKTIVYLAHPKACEVRESPALQQAMAIVSGTGASYGLGEETDQPRLVEVEKVEYRLGIFSAFIPQQVQKLIWKKDATPEELEKLAKRGITPVIIKDGDPDHA